MMIALESIWIIVILVLLLIVLGALFYFVPIGLWIAATFSGAGVGIGQLIAMRLRRVPPAQIVNARISGVKAGIKVAVSDLEAHYLAGGNVERVVFALISASKAGISLPFARGAAIDLAGRDVLEAVKMSVNPKVIQTPKVSAVAADGIQLIVVSRITLRANIERLVGGAGEETILARVGEGIVTTIGSAANHKQVLENPDSISRTVMSKGLDSGTAFEILSIDIADVDVGQNIGAKLQIDQAEADKNIAQAQAESRRAMAVAAEQEMKARYQEARSKVAEAEAQVPLAVAKALESGNLGALDYYNLRNVVADTQMRETIGKPEGGWERSQQDLGCDVMSVLERLLRLSPAELQRRFVLGEVLGPPLQMRFPPRRTSGPAASPTDSKPESPVAPASSEKPEP